MADTEHEGRDSLVIEELLRELDELRELDRRRNAHAPGSAAHDAATSEVDRRTKRLMDRFRDLEERRTQATSMPGANWTWPLDVREGALPNRGSPLN